MPIVNVCTVDWQLDRQEDGHRNYTLEQRIETDNYDYSPIQVLALATESAYFGGIPERGDYWTFGSNDLWAFATGEMDLKPEFLDGDQSYFWKATSKFSTVPNDASGSGTGGAENPTLDIPKISGGSEMVRVVKSVDKDGNALVNSAHEPLLGDGVERDRALPTVTIENNTNSNPMTVGQNALNKVNSVAMWGFGLRCVKLTDFSWEKIILTDGYVYYRASYTFTIDPSNWDTPILDEGTKVLIEGGDENNPGDFRRATAEGTDEKESKPVLLDGNGNRLGVGQNPAFLTYQIDEEHNHLLLPGVPAVL
jgi:hypothetical protein